MRGGSKDFKNCKNEAKDDAGMAYGGGCSVETSTLGKMTGASVNLTPDNKEHT